MAASSYPKAIDQATTAATTYYSNWVPKFALKGYSFVCTWGATTGTITVEVSNDPAAATSHGSGTTARKTELSITGITSPSGSTGSCAIDVETYAGYVRVVYTCSAGVGAFYADGHGVA